MKKIHFKIFPKIPLLEGIDIICGKANIKSTTRLDIGVIIFHDLANVAYVTTKSKTFAANIKWLKENKKIFKTKILMVNSGNANAYTGEEGFINLKTILSFLSSKFNCNKKEIIISSTGVIGEQLPMKKIMKTLQKLTGKTSEKYKMSWDGFAKSIMTTDTFPKAIYKTTKIGNKSVKLIGIAKGSGMIAPDMATMLGYIFTDADFTPRILKELLIQINEKSFNSITVDSDMSTNDMVCFFSTRKVLNSVSSVNDKSIETFKKDLQWLAIELAKKIIYDGEGATKLIEVYVCGSKNYLDAKNVALSIANSLLVKTAIAGEDANWGRIIMAIGKSKVKLDQSKISLKLGKNIIINKGRLKKKYNEKIISKYLKKNEILIEVNLNNGKNSSRVWTCDLTKKYIEINAHYRS
ncbi:MAG: bifunctional ornithine acetyltransferase/N-acetylglutamate synthase [Pelagibacterales bacterium]|nr:bifunctional ornithine acetyltransferase/N-acetylglutamate synthase [Pelagibacterales bacterium]OUU61582.1 MAG: bifunctional ornithine acetyltransferase/N-acetylglutamate synthase [Alphaproteobacteria bacterium TMED62]|tara:strand:- start:3788 stop:5014 length:1227 start_codon:yes stop_codon:yes gene_type:complete